VEINACFSTNRTGTTTENLKAAIEGEHEEHSALYCIFADVAEKEGFPQIADAWRAISVAEKHHEKRYKELLANIEINRVFKREEKVNWRCRNCGYIHTGEEAPKVCPACVHPQAHYEPLGENW